MVHLWEAECEARHNAVLEGPSSRWGLGVGHRWAGWAQLGLAAARQQQLGQQAQHTGTG